MNNEAALVKIFSQIFLLYFKRIRRIIVLGISSGKIFRVLIKIPFRIAGDSAGFEREARGFEQDKRWRILFQGLETKKGQVSVERLSGPLPIDLMYIYIYCTTISKSTLMLAFAASEYMFAGTASYFAGLVSPYPILVSLP